MVGRHGSIQVADRAVVDIKIVIRLAGTGVSPKHGDLESGAWMGSNVSRRKRHRQRVTVTIKCSGVAPRPAVQLSQPDARLVRDNEWTGIIRDDGINRRNRAA